MIATNIDSFAIFKSLQTLSCLLDDDEDDDEAQDDEDDDDDDDEDDDEDDDDAHDEDDDIWSSHDNISFSVLLRILLLTGKGLPVVLLTRDDTSSELLT